MNPVTTMNVPAPIPAPGRYGIDPAHTTVRFHTRHLFGLGGVSGTVRLREADLTVADPPTATTLHAVLDAASFDTGSPKRDADVRSAKYLDTDAYPDITFDCQTASQQNGKWVAAGTIYRPRHRRTRRAHPRRALRQRRRADPAGDHPNLPIRPPSDRRQRNGRPLAHHRNHRHRDPVDHPPATPVGGFCHGGER